MVGSVWGGSEEAGREGCWRGEEGMEVLACACVCVSRCVFVCVCMGLDVSREGRGQGEELEMQEVYRWARDRAAKKDHISDIRKTDMGVF